MLVTWFVLAATISAIPLFLEYSKVTRKYEIIKKPRHRHVRANNDAPFSDRKLHHKMKREKAINEANLDYQDQEDIEVGITTTIKPIMVKRTKNHVGKEVPECRLQIAETLPASVFEEKDLADNHLEMHTVSGSPIFQELGLSCSTTHKWPQSVKKRQTHLKLTILGSQLKNNDVYDVICYELKACSTGFFKIANFRQFWSFLKL